MSTILCVYTERYRGTFSHEETPGLEIVTSRVSTHRPLWLTWSSVSLTIIPPSEDEHEKGDPVLWCFVGGLITCVTQDLLLQGRGDSVV